MRGREIGLQGGGVDTFNYNEQRQSIIMIKLSRKRHTGAPLAQYKCYRDLQPCKSIVNLHCPMSRLLGNLLLVCSVRIIIHAHS
jgi:hypothetical protein